MFVAIGFAHVGTAGAAAPVSPQRSVAAGGEYACALSTTGTVACWGANGFGQLGDGSTTNSLVPVTVSGLSGVRAISTGVEITCALLGAGTVECWGSNQHGSLGSGSASGPQSCGFLTPCSTVPVVVSGLSAVRAISVGGSGACALITDGSVWCWGYNVVGQLGDGTATDSSVPVRVSGLSKVVAISSGGEDSCAVLAGGGAKCWGRGDFGQLGNGASIDSHIPVTVSGLSNVRAISVDGGGCALIADGTVDCWGENLNAALGIGNITGPETCGPIPIACSTRPVRVSGLTNAISIASNGGRTCAVLTDRTVACWGNNIFGALGDGSTNGPQLCHGFPCSTVPVAVSSLSAASSVTLGDTVTCALLTSGEAKCWGANNIGQLGIGSQTGPQQCFEGWCSTMPVGVAGLPPVPDAPTGVHAISTAANASIGALTVTYEAGADNGFTITKFTTICSSSDGGPTRTYVHTGATVGPIRVGGVATTKTYSCVVRAASAAGLSSFSARSKSFVVGAPAAPTGVNALKTGAGRLEVTFAPGATNGAAITKYTATCTSSDGGVTKARVGSRSPVVVTALTATKLYTCTVSATNAREPGLHRSHRYQSLRRSEWLRMSLTRGCGLPPKESDLRRAARAPSRSTRRAGTGSPGRRESDARARGLRAPCGADIRRAHGEAPPPSQ